MVSTTYLLPLKIENSRSRNKKTRKSRFVVPEITIFATELIFARTMKALKYIGTVPFDLSVLQSFYPNCKHITDKAIRLEKDGEIVRLKKGLYVANTDDGTLSRELLANRLYGPSYVSMSWALSWHGLIPERVYLIQSMTTKHSRKFRNAFGSFHYQNCPDAYFPLGITTQGNGKIHYLIASPEKALCDYICYHKITLRFIKEVGEFLEEDLRFDMDIIPDLDLDLIGKCAETSKKPNTLFTLLKFLKNERHI